MFLLDSLSTWMITSYKYDCSSSNKNSVGEIMLYHINPELFSVLKYDLKTKRQLKGKKEESDKRSVNGDNRRLSLRDKRVLSPLICRQCGVAEAKELLCSVATGH